MDGSSRPHLGSPPHRLRPAVGRLAAFLAILASTSGGPVWAQPTFSSGITQVEVYATVTDAAGRPVRGLDASDFRVLEDGVRQTIGAFVDGDFPASVALAIDRSFSMKGTPLTVAKTAGRAFLGALKSDDRAALISISGEVELLAPFGTDRAPTLQALERLDPWSTTSLNDALVRSFDWLDSETGRRALVVLSDGVDRYSEASDARVLDRARLSDGIVYPIAIGRARPGLFAELASLSGGRSFHLRDVRQLQTTLRTIADDLRAQYLIGYVPVAAPQGAVDYRNITVEVARPGLSVRARRGYLAR